MDKLKGFAKFLILLFVLVFMVVLGGVSAVYYENWERNMKEESNFSHLVGNTFGDVSAEVELEPKFTCLFMGRNQHLTDFIMLGQYDPNTRKVSLLSIPRDTYVGKSSIDGKINSIYRGKYHEKVMTKVTEITGVKIDHYVVFDTRVLRKLIDAMGGVTVDVPINMNYDDPYQDLYIHLKKGTQKLTGAQAEQFVRFRKNNDGTGYPNGDIGRIAAQQNFIKAVATELLKAENISNIGKFMDIVIDSTKTDITMDTISEYIDDVITFKTDRINMQTLPGVGKNGVGPDGATRSFYYVNEESAVEVINELFPEADVNGEYFSKTEDRIEVSSGSLEVVPDEDKIRVEVLSAKASATKFNDLVKKLKSNNCNVVKIGNYTTSEIESSRIITYGTHTEEELENIKSISGIKNVEEGSDESLVKFSIIIGANYK